MNTLINKDTKLYGSFSENPGNNGCVFFNNAFQKHNINAIYKSFYCNKLDKTIDAVKTLGFSGFALSIPHKVEVLKYLNGIDADAEEIGAINTVIIDDNKLFGYNTDWLGIVDFFHYINMTEKVNIIGTGGFSKAIQHACTYLNIDFEVFSRNQIETIENVENQTFINATPADIVSVKNKIIDARPTKDEGKQIALYQAKHQFKLYTGIDYE